MPPTDVIFNRTVPLFLLSADENGKVNVDKSAVLAERETSIAIDTSKPFKLNADTNGVCEYPCALFCIEFEDTNVCRPRAVYPGKVGEACQ